MIRKLDNIHPITVVYSGYKTPTVDVIKFVEGNRERFSDIFDGVFSVMDSSCRKAADAITHERWEDFGRILNFNYE